MEGLATKENIKSIDIAINRLENRINRFKRTMILVMFIYSATQLIAFYFMLKYL